jgi:predicted NAD/FAD-dependent oxidoreductase
VTVAGGGIAGLSAALRLAERGYQVKVFEPSARLGGNLGSRAGSDGVQHDVYPHMYLNWYRNLWQLLEDVTDGDPKRSFTPYSTVWQLRRGEYPRFAGTRDAYSPWNPVHVLENLRSGVAPPPDMFLFGYASVDLLAERLHTTVQLGELSISAFLGARPYMTDHAAEAYNSFITAVWALPSYLTSARDYQEYLEYCLADPTPAFWLPRRPAAEVVISPLVGALRRLGVEIVQGVRVAGVCCDGGRVSEISVDRGTVDPGSGSWSGSGESWREPVDELILAVPPMELSRLVRTGDSGRTVVERVPKMAELSRLRANPIPIIHLYLRRTLRGLPAEPVGLSGSSLALAFTDISQTWPGVFGDGTVLALSASDPYGLPRTSPEDDAFAILREAAEYLDFDPGSAWGEPGDIDWDRTRYNSNADAKLFINEIGTDPWRPPTRCEELANLCFAGDFCVGKIGMTTIESAVIGGVEAAAAIVAQRGFGEPVEVLAPRRLPPALYAWLRGAWAPYAAYAKWWSMAEDMARGAGSRVAEASAMLGRLVGGSRH